LTGTLGAEVTGVSLAEDLGDETISKLDASLAENKVLCFRNQRGFGEQEQLRFGRRLGRLMVFPFEPSSEVEPELQVLSAADRYPDRLVESWHSDLSCLQTPSRASILRAVEVPPYGRDTIWADMAAAYEGLSSSMQRFLDGLTAEHDYMRSYGTAMKKIIGDEAAIREQIPVPEHPVVRVHPVTGRRIIYVNKTFTTRIIGMRDDESNMLLRFLWDQTHIPEYQVRIRWQPGTVVMWDNRSTQHCLVFDRGQSAHRLMTRVTVEEDCPVGAAV
jgi:taurine dioxygenase